VSHGPFSFKTALFDELKNLTLQDFGRRCTDPDSLTVLYEPSSCTLLPMRRLAADGPMPDSTAGRLWRCRCHPAS